MEFDVYTVFDRVSGLYCSYGGLILHVNEASAIRWFGDVVAKHEHSHDLDLYYVGTFDTQSGFLEADKPVFVTNLATMSAMSVSED